MEKELSQTGSMKEELALIRKVVDAAPAMLAYWGPDERCLFANAAYERWFGVKPEALIGTTLRELLGPLYEINLPHIQAALSGEPQSFEREIPDPAGGAPRYSQAHYLPDIEAGRVKGFIVMVSDISIRRAMELGLREAERREHVRATHDLLTGLPNRMLLEDRWEQAIADSKRQWGHCGVLFVDLDGFKAINDSFGHIAGDAVLREVATRLRSVLRQADTVARQGGDEFIVLIPNLEAREDAGFVAQKLLDALANAPFCVGAHEVTLSGSAGVAVWPEHGSSLAELVAHSDHALYQAKQAGKNKYAFYAPRGTDLAF